MLFGVYENEDFRRQICYIFETFFSIYGMEWKAMSYGQLSESLGTENDVFITYGRRRKEGDFLNQIHIYASDLFGPQYLKPPSMPREPLEYFGDLPIIYQAESRVQGHVRRDGITETDIDIIASSFFMLTRYEEVLREGRDRFGRFPGHASLAFREGFLCRPIVNEYLDLLWGWISSFNIRPVRKKLWYGKDLAVALTYDIDRLRKYSLWPPLRTMANSTFKHGKPKRSLNVIWDYTKAKIGSDPFDTFDYLISHSETYGFPLTFYFMSGGETTYDRRYRADTPYVNSLAHRIVERGHEIGLHSSFNSSADYQMLKKEKETLERVRGEAVCGVRQHYLCWKTPQSWQAREQAGFKYDASLTFADHEGFRCGLCYPFQPFDLLENRIMDLWEIPTTVTDRGLFSYQGLSSKDAKERIILLIDEVKAHGGVFVLLWHNSSFDELSEFGSKYVWEEVVKFLHSQNSFNGTVQEIIKVWENRIGNS